MEPSPPQKPLPPKPFWRRKWFLNLALTILIFAGLKLVWDINFPSATVRYRVTVSIETPEGLKTGSAVREMRVATEPKIFPEQHSIHSFVYGEAVVIDLGVNGRLFAVMDINDYQIFYRTIPVPKYGSIISSLHFLRNLKSGPITSVPLSARPEIIRFRDLKDPASLEMIYQVVAVNVPNQSSPRYQVNDNFEKIFGSGVRLKDVTLQVTTDKVSHTDIDEIVDMFGGSSGGYSRDRFVRR